MANVRKNRWSLRAHLKESNAPHDQHPQVRREDEKSNNTIEDEIPQESESDE
jgi:hypothetical protein